MATEAPTYTAERLEQGVHNALEAHDVRAAVDILEALAAVDIDRAVRLYGELQDALTVVRVLRGAAPDTEGRGRA
jgi:hypothetical protein